MNVPPNRKLVVSTEKIIHAIKKRPALYSRKDPEYFTMNRFKGKLWKEVCKEVFDNWDQLKPHQRVEYDCDLRKRWKSLRTCFTRELGLQKKEQEDSSTVRLRKQYAYFDQMAFLLECDSVKISDVKSSRSSAVLEEDSNDDYDNDDDPLDAEELEEVVVKPEQLEIEQYEPEGSIEQMEGRHTGVFQEKMIDVLENMKRDEEDEDKQFMMSLVPSMRKLNAKQKFEAKIAILKVLKDITFKE